jgi:hypothetical protein
MVVAPVFVIVDPASTEKGAAVPSPTVAAERAAREGEAGERPEQNRSHARGPQNGAEAQARVAREAVARGRLALLHDANVHGAS